MNGCLTKMSRKYYCLYILKCMKLKIFKYLYKYLKIKAQIAVLYFKKFIMKKSWQDKNNEI